MKNGCALILMPMLCWAAWIGLGRAEPLPAEPYFTFQVMILSQETSARRTLTDLRQKGFPAYLVVRDNQSGRTLYKVRVGKYATRSEAREAALDFKERERHPYVLLKSQIDIPLAEIAADAQAARVHAGADGPKKAPDSDSDNQTEAADNETSTGTGLAGKAPIALGPTVTVPPGKPDAYYTFQFGSMRSEALANETVEQMRRKGYPAYVVAKQDKESALLYKLRVGKYSSREEAEKAAMDFAAGESLDTFVLESQIDLPVGLLSADPPTPEPGEAVRAATPEKKQAQAPEQQPAGRSAWPGAVTKIYSYRSPSGALNLTNRYANIPKESHKDINQVSVFPVRYRHFDLTGSALVFDVDGEEKRVRLSGVGLPRSLRTDYVKGYVALNLESVALRLKYSPWETDVSGALLGVLYLKEGTCINTDMVRQGIGTCDTDSIPAEMRRECNEAEALARNSQIGIWHPR